MGRGLGTSRPARALLDIRWRVRMRTFIFALAAIVPASCVIDRAGAADEVPAFDIARNCNEETAGSGIGRPQCWGLAFGYWGKPAG